MNRALALVSIKAKRVHTRESAPEADPLLLAAPRKLRIMSAGRWRFSPFKFARVAQLDRASASEYEPAKFAQIRFGHTASSHVASSG
jgi:hypothetical protein